MATRRRRCAATGGARARGGCGRGAGQFPRRGPGRRARRGGLPLARCRRAAGPGASRSGRAACSRRWRTGGRTGRTDGERRSRPGATRECREPADPAAVPVRSSLLARSAALPPVGSGGPRAGGRRSGGPRRLAPGEVLALGRVVGDMLAAGAPPDVGRGVRHSPGTPACGCRARKVDLMFREFAELEVTVGGVLTGRDLRPPGPAAAQASPLDFDGWFNRTSPRDGAGRRGDRGEQRAGAPRAWSRSGTRGWRCATGRVIPQSTFELLVRPWVTVVGRLPEP